MSNRLADIDIAKGICIGLVVIGHYIPANSPKWYLTLIEVIYCFHMPLFMVASGFIYQATLKPVPYPKFVWKKFKRLVIPYFLVSWFIIGIKLLTEKNMYVENPVSLSSFYEILYIPSAGYFLWFVYVLFLVFLIIPFFRSSRKINVLLFVSFVWLIIPVQTTDLFCIAQLKSNLFYFVAGCFMSQYQSIIRPKVEKIPVISLLCGFVVLFLLTRVYNDLSIPVVLKSIYVCLALTGIGITVKISQYFALHTQKIKHVFVKLAFYSYTIYLFHTSFEGLAKSFFVKYPLTGYAGYSISFLITVLVTVSIGIVGPIFLHQFYLIGKKIVKNRKLQ